jgi:SAM-dependent methyltransferase
MSGAVFDLALQEWQTEAGVQGLLAAWNGSPEKAEAETLVGRLLAMFAGEAKSVADLGCGAGRHAPVLFEYLPKLRRYTGYDSSAGLLAQARADHGDRAGVTLVERDIFDGAPYQLRHRPDAALSIDTSRHYHDPMEFLRTLASMWPARAYCFSVLHGAPAELINGRVVGTRQMEMGLADIGETLGFQEVELYPGASVRYVV